MANDNNMKNLEDLLARIGNANRFQVIMFLFIKLPTALISWTMFEMSFAKAQPEWCCAPEGVDDPEHYCYSGNGTFGTECPDDVANCSLRVFDDKMNTIVNEWSLLCGEEWKTDLTISVQMAGVLVGCVITGQMADMFGRKKTFYAGVMLLTISSLLAGFSQSWEMFLVMRFLLGVSCGNYLVVNIPYMMEFLSPSKRELPSLVPIDSFGVSLMTLTAWLLHDWRWVHWICAALMLPLLFSWLFIPESLRWLTVKGKLDKAEDVVAYIARVNRKVVPKGSREVLEMVFEQEREIKELGKNSYNYFDIYRTRNLFKISVSLQVIWFAFSFCGYGVFFSASTLQMNLYLNIFLMGAAYAPINLVLEFFMARIGRKTIAVFLISVITLCAFAALAVFELVSDENTRDLTTNVLSLVGYSFLYSAWSVIMVLNSESYPTVLRSLGYAAANTCSRIGGILAPFAFDFDARATLSYSMIGGFMAMCTILTILLNETHGLNMADTLREADIEKEFSTSIRQHNSYSVDSLLGSGKAWQRNSYGGLGQSDSGMQHYTPNRRDKTSGEGRFSSESIY